MHLVNTFHGMASVRLAHVGDVVVAPCHVHQIVVLECHHSASPPQHGTVMGRLLDGRLCTPDQLVRIGTVIIESTQEVRHRCTQVHALETLWPAHLNHPFGLKQPLCLE